MAYKSALSSIQALTPLTFMALHKSPLNFHHAEDLNLGGSRSWLGTRFFAWILLYFSLMVAHENSV